MSDDRHGEAALAGLRSEIDKIDAKLVELLAQRVKIVSEVIVIKQREGLPANIPQRVDDVIAAARERAKAAGVPDDLAETLWRTLVAWTIDHEDRILARASNARDTGSRKET